MNQLDAYVTEVIGPIFEKYHCWWVPVIYECWGQESSTNIMCKTKEEAEAVTEGHKFLT